MSAFLNRLCGCLTAAWLMLACSAMSAFAHAVLLSAAPDDGAVLEEAPIRVVLTFNEPVGPLATTLIMPDGQQRDLLKATTGGSDLVVNLPADLSEGTHVVSWRVVSTDGHPIGGVTVFSIGVVTGHAPAIAVRTDPAVSVALWVSKLVLYTALFFGIGGAVFAATVAPLPPFSERLAKAAILSGLLAAPISLGLQGADALGLGPAEMLGTSVWRAGFSTSYGWTAVGCLAALALAGLSLNIRGRRSSALAIAALLAVPLSLAMSGHASAAEPQWITRSAVFLHVAGIMFWIGALPPLAGLLRKGTQDASVPLARFSAIIPYPVAAILVSGIALAVVQLGAQPAFWLSPYGVILACKLGLLTALFGLAILNRFGLTRSVLDGDARAGRHLRRNIGIEVVLVAVIIGLVAGWRFTPPPRALAEAARPPVSLHIHTSAAMADVTITPGRAGTNMLAIFVADGDFAPVTPLEVSAAISSPALGIEPSRRPATLRDDGLWQTSGVSIPLAGEWRIDLEIRLSRFELVRLTGTFTIP